MNHTQQQLSELIAFKEKWGTDLEKDEFAILYDLIASISLREHVEWEQGLLDGSIEPERSDDEEHGTWNKTLSGVT